MGGSLGGLPRVRVTETSEFGWCLVLISQATVTSLGPLPSKAMVWFSWAESLRLLLPTLVSSCPAGLGSVSPGGWLQPGREGLDSGQG